MKCTFFAWNINSYLFGKTYTCKKHISGRLLMLAQHSPDIRAKLSQNSSDNRHDDVMVTFATPFTTLFTLLLSMIYQYFKGKF